MGKSKREKIELDPAEAQAELERKQAKVRGKFEKKTKLKRHIFKSEVS